ncbi:DUF2252 domain-containing protein [Gordonia sp. HNM0687]|uniref:DUF2252 domain-containing protein n=1 Tax=Gordonia mangrovi TaxID=2665643 RepID=A0A6L7GWC6_9ACTN|nr:DUF2252 domain-containing protein [Gordonia mangrovi]MXP23767.1 DUF2252 domain-containing protein [Gordonia mangrovi]UVF79821.1 DUF2252 domain-containing protein [Gordonia mangrovi]
MTATITDLATCVDPDGRDDAIAILTRQAASRVPELVPVRNSRMAATPFTFFRGAAAVMAADLAAVPHSGVMTQLCGDAHLSNFGLFNTPERRMIFDLNDFDETAPGPFEWDVKRLAASFTVAGRGNGFDAATTRKHARDVAKSYQKWMMASATMSTMDCWYARIDADDILTKVSTKLDTSTEERTLRGLRKAQHRNSAQAVAKLCVIDADGNVHIRSDPPLLVPIHELFPDARADEVANRVASRVGEYRTMLPDHIRALFDQFSIVDVARKVVGVGSVGTRAWIVLLHGARSDDPLFLQMKEAQRSVLADHVPAQQYANQGQRVVEGQRLLQAASDVFLGWTSGLDENDEKRDLYVRQLRDGKGSVVIEALNPDDMKLYAKLCGRALAHAHARTGSRLEIADYLGSAKGFADAIADFSVAYADIDDNDHAAMLDAIRSGRLETHDLV